MTATAGVLSSGVGSTSTSSGCSAAAVAAFRNDRALLPSVGCSTECMLVLPLITGRPGTLSSLVADPACASMGTEQSIEAGCGCCAEKDRDDGDDNGGAVGRWTALEDRIGRGGR